jgi:hypothetical protein
MCAEAGTVLRAVAEDSSITVGVWRSLRITVIGTYQDASTIMHKTLGKINEILENKQHFLTSLKRSTRTAECVN